jgi:hypothetical protein
MPPPKSGARKRANKGPNGESKKKTAPADIVVGTMTVTGVVPSSPAVRAPVAATVSSGGGDNTAVRPFSTKTGLSVSRSMDGPLQMLVVTNEPTPSVGTSDVTSAELYELLRKKGRMGDDIMLHKDLVLYVRNDLFPKLKFIMDTRQLMFTTAVNSICYQICSELGFEGIKAAEWWEKYKNKVAKTLNSKRADVTSAIKRVFISKYQL